MDSQDILEQSNQCYLDDAPPCGCACPLGVDVRGIMEKLRKGLTSAAYKLYQKDVVFPGIVSHICDAPCEHACIRRETDDSIALLDAERFLWHTASGQSETPYKILDKNKTIGIVGGGLMGLSCASKLVGRGYTVVVFEIESWIGGRLIFHSTDDARAGDDRPSVPDEILTAEFERLAASRFLTIQTDTDVLSVSSAFESVAPRETETLVETPNVTGRKGCADGDGQRQTDSFADVPDTAGTITVYLKSGCSECFDAVLVATGTESWSSRAVVPGIFYGNYDPEHSSVEAIRQGVAFSYLIETWLKVGRMESLPVRNEACKFRLDDIFYASERRGAPRGAREWTKEDARAEAERCMLCSCRSCLNVCDLLEHYNKNPKKAIIESVGPLGRNVVGGSRAAIRQILSCTLCGACGHECPADIDLGKMYLELRRTLHKNGKLPDGYYDFWMRDLAFSRTDAALTLSPDGSILTKQTSLSYVYFPGCQAGASDPAYVRVSWNALKDKYADTIALMLYCCGAPAAWAGDENLHAEIRADILAFHRDTGMPKFILACPSCMDMFEKYLPEIETVSIWEAMETPPAHGETPRAGGEFSVFDPCASRPRPEVQQAVRRLIESIGNEIRELSSSGDRARCCGYGGLIASAAPELYHKIGEKNAQLGELPFVTYCVNCRDSLASNGKEALHLFDLLFDLPGDRGNRKPPTLSERRRNRMLLKEELMNESRVNEISEETDSALFVNSEAMKQPGAVRAQNETLALHIEIPDEIRTRMQKELILDEDVAAVIEHAVSSGVSVLDEHSGEHTAHLQIGKLTYWVCYLPPESAQSVATSPAPESAPGKAISTAPESSHGNAALTAPESAYRVVRVYCHRMELV